MIRKSAQVFEIYGGQCWDRTNDKLIKSHVLLYKNQSVGLAHSVKPSLACQYVALILSNFSCGFLVASAWMDFIGGRHV